MPPEGAAKPERPGQELTLALSADMPPPRPGIAAPSSPASARPWRETLGCRPSMPPRELGPVSLRK
jgi:hypothetical protein